MSAPSSADRRSELRRTVGLLAPTIAGPVASIWSNSLAHQSMRNRRASDCNEQRSGRAGVKFTLTKTEDAMDSVIPCVAEELFRPMMQNRFGNPARLHFQYSNCSSGH